MPARPLRLIAALFAAVFLLGACGDDGEDTADDTTTTAAADDTTTTTDDEGTTTTEPEGPTDTTTDGDDSAAGSVSVEEVLQADDFCELNALGEAVDTSPFDLDPSATDEEAEAALALSEQLYAQGLELAPEEIEGDFELLVESYRVFFEALAEYDYDFMALMAAAQEDPALGEELQMDSPELTEASDNVTQWVDENC